MKPADSGYADVNGLHMYYEVYGTGKPIVLLHGSYMNIALNWSRIIPLLAKDRKVIAAEMQGHGRTRDIPREFSYEGMADDVSGLLEHLKIESADILGYSMGGGVAFQVAVRHPEKVRRLVVLSGVYAHDGWWPIGDADGVRYEHAVELFRVKGGGKMGDIHGLPKSRLAILPSTTHIGMMRRTDWLIPMISDFLDSDLDTAPPTF